MTDDQTVTQALEPCPWCGTSEHLSVQSVGALTSDMPDRPYRTICTHIDHDTVIGPTAYGKRAAITAWNTRTAHSGEGRETCVNCDGGGITRDDNPCMACGGSGTRTAARTGEGRSNGAKRSVIERAVADDLIAAIYKAEGWIPGDKAGFETRTARCSALYEITADARRNRYVATPLSTPRSNGAGEDRNDIEPLLDGCDSPEPSLREIVRRYYSKHFDPRRADELTDDYFASLSQSEGAKSE